MINKAVKTFLGVIFSLTVISACNNDNGERTNADNKKSEGKIALKSSHDSLKTGEKIAWHSFTDAVKKSKQEKKYMFIDFYTDWCGYCKKLDKETYSKEKIYNYLNDKFIPVKVNAESKNKIVFDGKTMTEQELAATFGVTSYPTMFFLSNEKEAIGQIPGFVDHERFFSIASYVATDSYKTKTFEQFEKNQTKI